MWQRVCRLAFLLACAEWWRNLWSFDVNAILPYIRACAIMNNIKWQSLIRGRSASLPRFKGNTAQCTKLLRSLYCTKFEGGLGKGQAMHVPRLCSFLLSLGGSSPLVHVFVHLYLHRATPPLFWKHWPTDTFVGGERTLTSNSSCPCLHFFIPLLNLLIKSTLSLPIGIQLCKMSTYVNLLKLSTSSVPLVHFIFFYDSQIVQWCDTYITLKITWLLVYLCYNHVNILLHFPDVTLSRGDCCRLSIWPLQKWLSVLRFMWEWVWYCMPHESEPERQYCKLPGNESLQVIGMIFLLLQVPSSLGLPSSSFNGCFSGS